MKPQVRILDRSEIERIHELSLQILERTGIVVHYPPAQDLLRGQGAVVDEASGLVRIPRGLVEQALQLAPRRVSLFGQANATRDCLLGVDGGLYARTSTGLNWIVDAGAKARRPVRQADVVAWTRVAHALSDIHIVGAAYDQEGPPQAMEVRALNAMLRFTDKPLMISAVSGEGMRWAQRLCEVVQPSDRLPRVAVLSSVNSPLTYSYGQVEAAMVAAEVGIPVFYNSSAVAGVTAPVTLAGAIAQINAEMLAALTIVQLHRPGAPVVHSAHPMVMDMRTGLACIGGCEVGLMAAACVEIGRFYGLPTACNGLGAESCTPDAMAVIDKMSSGYLAALCGANVNGAAGAIAAQSIISLEQLVIDDDIYGNIFRQARGIVVDDETLAAEVIDFVGPGGSFLAEDHTLRHFRSELRDARLADRLNAPAWAAAGGKDVLARAAEIVQRILAAPARPMLADDQARALDRLVNEATQALEKIDTPV
jgi:trimethylamine--corrinoid protein Co-methyltransferase